MKVLIICRWIPFPSTTNALSYRVLGSIKYLSEKYKHDITLATFKYKNNSEDYIREYCNKIITVEEQTTWKKWLTVCVTDYLRGVFKREITLKKGNYFYYRYSHELQKKINELIKDEKFDIIYVDNPTMLFYASAIELPKVLEIWTVTQTHYEAYKIHERKLHKKIYRWLLYFEAKIFEKKYSKFDICVTPTEHDKEIISSYLKNLEISVVPFGVDPYSKEEDYKEDFPSLLFLGNMGSVFNQRSVLNIYNNIYPYIKEVFPQVKLFVVGKDPSEEIIQLTKDKSVIVTGYVENIRQYLASASIIILPIHGYGIKTRVLEAMSAGKPVITSSQGIYGINATPGKNIIIADNENDFTENVIKLLKDEQLRKSIGVDARRFIEEEYTWEIMADKLNGILQRAFKKYSSL